MTNLRVIGFHVFEETAWLDYRSVESSDGTGGEAAMKDAWDRRRRWKKRGNGLGCLMVLTLATLAAIQVFFCVTIGFFVPPDYYLCTGLLFIGKLHCPSIPESVVVCACLYGGGFRYLPSLAHIRHKWYIISFNLEVQGNGCSRSCATRNKLAIN